MNERLSWELFVRTGDPMAYLQYRAAPLDQCDQLSQQKENVNHAASNRQGACDS